MTTVASPPKPTAPAAARPVSPPPTSAPRLDEAVARVREGASRLLRLSLDERVALARSMQAGYLGSRASSVHAACAAKGIPLGTPLEGEEWTLGPLVRRAPPSPDPAVAAGAQAHRQHAASASSAAPPTAAGGAGVPRRPDRRHPVQGRPGGRAPPGRGSPRTKWRRARAPASTRSTDPRRAGGAGPGRPGT